MKRLAFLSLFVITGFLFCSCEEYYRTKQVKNDSDYTVTFTFNHFEETEYTLKPHASDYYTEKPYIKSFSATPPRVSYTTDYDNETVTFYNTPARSIKIINKLDKDILVTANGCMDNEPVTVLADSELTANIYTSKPEFKGATVVDKFPVKFTTSVNGLTVLSYIETE